MIRAWAAGMWLHLQDSISNPLSLGKLSVYLRPVGLASEIICFDPLLLANGSRKPAVQGFRATGVAYFGGMVRAPFSGGVPA